MHGAPEQERGVRAHVKRILGKAEEGVVHNSRLSCCPESRSAGTLRSLTCAPPALSRGSAKRYDVAGGSATAAGAASGAAAAGAAGFSAFSTFGFSGFSGF